MATQTLLTTGTTFVSSALANYNLASNTIIAVGAHPVYQDSISFLKFDLSSLPVNSVKSAILRLFVFSKTEGAHNPIVVNRVISDFDMNPVTYNIRPSYVPAPSISGISIDEVLQYIETDVTALVNQWLDRTFPDYGFALSNSDGTTFVQLGGKPIGAAYEPQLVLTYSPRTAGNMIGIQAQLQESPDTLIADSANVIFDTIINDYTEGILYNSSTGKFTISEAGKYYIKWWVEVDGSDGPANMKFSLLVDGSSVSEGISPNERGQVDGAAFLTVSDSPVTLSLANQTGAGAVYADIPVQANITIYTIT